MVSKLSFFALWCTVNGNKAFGRTGTRRWCETSYGHKKFDLYDGLEILINCPKKSWKLVFVNKFVVSWKVPSHEV